MINCQWITVGNVVINLSQVILVEWFENPSDYLLITTTITNGGGETSYIRITGEDAKKVFEFFKHNSKRLTTDADKVNASVY